MKKIKFIILILALSSCKVVHKQYAFTRHGSVASNGDVPHKYLVSNKGVNLWNN